MVAALTMWAPALFADGAGSEFGVVYGLSVPDAENTGAFRLFGVKGEAFILPQFSIGGYYLESDNTGQISDAIKFNYNLTGVEAAYHLPASDGDTYIAFRMGLTKLRENPNLVDTTYSPYHYGFATGFDYYLTSMFSIGFEGSYLHVLPGRTQLNSVIYEQPSFNLINFLVSLQLRL